MTNHRHLIQRECVEDPIYQRKCLVADLTALEPERIRQAVAWKVHREQLELRKLRKQWRPNGGVERRAVEQHQRRPAPMR